MRFCVKTIFIFDLLACNYMYSLFRPVCVCVCVCVHACVHACVRACVCVLVGCKKTHIYEESSNSGSRVLQHGIPHQIVLHK